MSAASALSAAAAAITPMGFRSRYGATASWFPGHMATAARALASAVRAADVVIEVRDARVPFSSSNPLLDAVGAGGFGSGGAHERARDKPRVVVFNKADLADPQLQRRVAAHEAARSGGGGGGRASVFCSANRGANVAALLRAVDAVPDVRATSLFRSAGAVMVVVGVPNAGKSSLINALRGATGCTQSRGASTAPTPGWTRAVSTLRVRRDPPLYLLDSPGVMPPRVPDVETGLKLAVTAAISAAAGPPARVQAEFLLFHFATVGSRRFADTLGLSRAYGAEDVEECLAELAAKLGLRRSARGGRGGGGGGGGGGVEAAEEAALGDGCGDVHGGDFDLDAAARHLVRAFQDGRLGRYTLDYVPP
jgi:ribosome biogenesis GTPase A